MEEMLEDTLAMDEDEELEEEADVEVDKVLFDLTNGKLGQAGSVRTELPVSVVTLSYFLPRLICRLSERRTNWKTRRRNELWNSTEKSSTAY